MKMKIFLFFKLIYKYLRFLCRQHRLKTNEKVIVNTTLGPIEGVKRFTCFDLPYYSFDKIPFGKPPIGELRFKDPQPCDPWIHLYDSTVEIPASLQTDLLVEHLDGTEDCLYLKVFTKNFNANHPVMVFFHGGGFVSGDCKRLFYSPDYFMEKDIVIIMSAYRCGVFGFLSFDDPRIGIPGNAGLKDQTLALRWVKENCSKFGGDPNNITVFGESAGGTSAHYHMISEHSKDLFHKAILMSGNIFCPWSIVPSRNWAYRLAKYMGYNGAEIDESVYKYLAKVKGTKLVYAQKDLLTDEEKKDFILFPFGPVIETYKSDQCFISKEPRLLAQEAWSKNIPTIVGNTSFEGLLFRNYGKWKDIKPSLGDFEHLVPIEVNSNRNSDDCKQDGLKLKEIYFNNNLDITEKNALTFFELLTDKMFIHGTYRTGLSRLKYSKGPTYMYRFDFDSPYFNHIRILFCGKRMRGVCHADDLSYLFYNMFVGNLTKNCMEYKMIERMIGMWTKFADCGDPNCDEIKPAIWEPIDKKGNILKCLNISNDVRLVDLPEYDRIAVWNNFYKNDNLI